MTWLVTDDRDTVRWLILNRPERKNAIPGEGWGELKTALDDFAASEQRVLVLVGSGGDFCSGADIDPADLGKLTTIAMRHRRMKEVGSVAMSLHRLGKPTIAAVDGVAIGAGMNLALGCDIVIATQRARFSEIFVRRGMTIDAGGSWLLPRTVGLQRAKELVLSGRIVDADEAARIGLALEVVAHDDLESRVTEVAESLLTGAPLAQNLAKQMLNASFGSSFGDAVSWEGQSQAVLMGSEDLTEGVEAFKEKRDPEWTGK